jgi:hypothetical protein
MRKYPVLVTFLLPYLILRNRLIALGPALLRGGLRAGTSDRTI